MFVVNQGVLCVSPSSLLPLNPGYKGTFAQVDVR